MQTDGVFLTVAIDKDFRGFLRNAQFIGEQLQQAFGITKMCQALLHHQQYGVGAFENAAGERVQLPGQKIGVLSSNDLQDMVRKSQQVGAAFYMVKPFTMEGLQVVLEGDQAAIRAYQPDVGEGRIIAF